jgi:hypothetical protein
MMASCDQCPFVAEPVNLLTRQMYVTSRTAASIDIPISPDHSLKFEVGYDSPTAKADYLDDVSGVGGTQLPFQRTLGMGVRHSWDHRLIFDDPTNPQVVTWLHGKGSVILVREDTGPSGPMRFRAVPGRSDQLTSVDGQPGQWRLLSNDGDLLLFEQSPGTASHPWSGANHQPEVSGRVSIRSQLRG